MLNKQGNGYVLRLNEAGSKEIYTFKLLLIG